MESNKYKTCDKCCYDILDDEGDVMEHECIESNNNKLIAEFMGMTAHHQDKGCMIFMTPQGHNDIVYVTDLEYHKDWNWLMPVVHKCLDVYHIELMNDDLNFEIYDSIGDIKNTYQAVVEFINEYNRRDGRKQQIISF